MALLIPDQEIKQDEQTVAQNHFDEAHWFAEGKSEELTKAANRRAVLAARHDEARRSARAAARSALDVIDDAAGFTAAVRKISDLKIKAAILEQSELHFAAFDLMDARRAVIIARQSERESRRDLEQARLDAHLAEALNALAEAAAITGDVTIQGDGPITEKLRGFVRKSEEDIRNSREALQSHDEEAAQLRAAYEARYGTEGV